MKEKTIALLESRDWKVECECPLEIRHKDGSFATMQAALIVLEYLEYVNSNS